MKNVPRPRAEPLFQGKLKGMKKEVSAGNQKAKKVRGLAEKLRSRDSLTIADMVENPLDSVGIDSTHRMDTVAIDTLRMTEALETAVTARVAESGFGEFRAEHQEQLIPSGAEPPQLKHYIPSLETYDFPKLAIDSSHLQKARVITNRKAQRVTDKKVSLSLSAGTYSLPHIEDFSVALSYPVYRRISVGAQLYLDARSLLPDGYSGFLEYAIKPKALSLRGELKWAKSEGSSAERVSSKVFSTMLIRHFSFRKINFLAAAGYNLFGDGYTINRWYVQYGIRL